MQKRIICLVSVCAVFVIMPAVGFSGTVEDGAAIDTALRGIRELSPYVLMYWTGGTPDAELAEEIEERAAKALKEAGFKIGSSEPNEAMLKVLKRRIPQQHGKIRMRTTNMPELMIRIYAIRHQAGRYFVFNVQTSLARKVYTAWPPRRVMKAEVWRIDVGPGATDANSFKAALTDAVLGQVNTFITAYKKAEQESEISSDAQRQDTAASVIKRADGKESASEAVKDSYVASKNSKIFHRADCPSAKRISRKNLISYTSRAEAVQDGKRPCKICKP